MILDYEQGKVECPGRKQNGQIVKEYIKSPTKKEVIMGSKQKKHSNPKYSHKTRYGL